VPLAGRKHKRRRACRAGKAGQSRRPGAGLASRQEQASVRPVTAEARRALRPARSCSPPTCFRGRRPAGFPGRRDRRVWKRLGSTRRKQTAAALARRIPESPAISLNRRWTEADGSSLRAHGMQEVVGSSPTSSTGNGLQNGRFGRASAGRGSGREALLEALTPTRRLSVTPARDGSRPDRQSHTMPRRARWCLHAGAAFRPGVKEECCGADALLC